MSNIKRNSEYLGYQPGHSQKKPQRNITDEGTRMIFNIPGKPVQLSGRKRKLQYRVRLKSFCNMAVLYFILYIAGNDTAKKKKEPCITGIEQR